jgi:hypothetical protein
MPQPLQPRTVTSLEAGRSRRIGKTIVSSGSEGTQVHKLPRLHIGGLGSIRPQPHLHLTAQTTFPLGPIGTLHVSAGEDTWEAAGVEHEPRMAAARRTSAPQRHTAGESIRLRLNVTSKRMPSGRSTQGLDRPATAAAVSRRSDLT